jgi:16S rRNA processing protein RimM
MGVIGRPHGVRGLVRVTSYADDLTAYGPLSDGAGRRYVLHWSGEGVAEIAELCSGTEVRVADRTAAAKLVNTQLYVDRAQLPEPDDDEFYLADLVGLIARDAKGTNLGTISAVHDYGAGASLEVERDDGSSLVVPFTRTSVPEIDVTAGHVVIAPPVSLDLARIAGEVREPSKAGEDRCSPAEPRLAVPSGSRER